MSSPLAALRYVAGSKGSTSGTVSLRCHVKPGAAKAREGVMSLQDDVVEICVAAAAREGEANKAVIAVLSEALDLPKSDLQILSGMKSRQKTVAVGGRLAVGGENECLERVRRLLNQAAGAEG